MSEPRTEAFDDRLDATIWTNEHQAHVRLERPARILRCDCGFTGHTNDDVMSGR
ncbi:MAG TPA: hypothetical protein VI485_25850 [Vicinamibacterales bacterium]|nr:hypothetical protein [Vicinamibacterales bacterium]